MPALPLTTAPLEPIIVRLLGQPALPPAREHSVAHAIVGIRATGPRVLPLITARTGTTARQEESPPALTLDREPTPALATPGILETGRHALVRLS